MADISKELAQAKELIATTDLLVVSKTWCPDCHYAKRVFADLNASPKWVELDELDNGTELQRAFLEITGQNTVPNVFIKTKHIGTEDDIKRLEETGELKKMLEEEGLAN